MAVHEFSYEITTPDQIQMGEWRGIQQLERQAFGADLMSPELGVQRRTQADVDQFVGWHDFDHYVATRLDPNIMVGVEMRGNQEYSEPHVVLAHDGEKPVGVLYTALNLSGSDFARQVKRHMPSRTYVWQRTIAVHPEHRNNGIATAMTRVELEQRDSRMKTTAYVWSELMGVMYERLVKRGFVETAVDPGATPFGANGGRVRTVRMEAGVTLLKRQGLKPDDEAQSRVIRHALQSAQGNNNLHKIS